jgi:hypothetical protein
MAIKRSIAFGSGINENTAKGVHLIINNNTLVVSSKNTAYEIASNHSIEIESNIDDVDFHTNANKLLLAIEEVKGIDVKMQILKQMLFVKESNLTTTIMGVMPVD